MNQVKGDWSLLAGGGWSVKQHPDPNPAFRVSCFNSDERTENLKEMDATGVGASCNRMVKYHRTNSEIVSTNCSRTDFRMISYLGLQSSGQKTEASIESGCGLNRVVPL